MRMRRSFSPEFKAQVVLELLSGTKSAAELCREHQLKPEMLTRWKSHFLTHVAELFESDKDQDREEAQTAELERMIGKLTLELEIAKKASNLFRSHLSRNGRRL